MAIPTFINVGSAEHSTGAITPTLPAAIQADDILVMFVTTDTGQAGTISDQAGGTWTQAGSSPQDETTAPGCKLLVYWSRYNGSQTAPTVGDTGSYQVAQIAAYRGGLKSGDPFNITSGDIETTSDSSVSVPGATTTVNDCLVLFAVANSVDTQTGQLSGGSWTNADLSSPTNRVTRNTDAGNGGGVNAGDGGKAAAGSYTNTTGTLLNNSPKAMWSGALAPVAGFVPKIVRYVN